MQCARCGGKGTVLGEGTASIPCPNCGGSGQMLPVSGMTQGCVHYGIRTGPTSDPYWMPQPSKTLLDEFAMAALPGCVSIHERLMNFFNLDRDDFATASEMAYTQAAAMMKERARRDEMGNVKEVK